MARARTPTKTTRAQSTKPRKRRTADEARMAILDAAERRLVVGGPAGIRLQEVATDVGISHPAVLHHFGSREALVEAVVARALDSLNQSIVAALAEAPPDRDRLAEILSRVSTALVKDGHARAFLWLALSGYEPALNERIRRLAETVHDVRRVKRGTARKLPPFEDTYFTVLLPALALMALSVLDGSDDEKPLGPRRFRAWLALVMHDHLESYEPS